jgi:hypothetical protein
MRSQERVDGGIEPGATGSARGRPSVVTLVAVVGVLVATAALAAWMTSPRMVRLTDSAAYLGAAHNISEGKGLTTPFALPTERATPDRQWAWGDELPLSEWPPGYPIALAATDALGADGGAAAARWVSVVGLVALAGGVMAALTLTVGRSPALLVLGPALVLLGPARQSYLGNQGPLGQSPMIMSERLFLPLAIWTLVAAAWPGPRRRAVDRLTVAAVALGVAASTATRYIGAVLGAAAALVVLLDVGRSRRFRALVALGLAATGPMVVAITSAVAGGTPKSLAWHTSAVVGPVVDQASAWFHIPRGWPFAVRLVMVGVIVVGPIVATAVRWWHLRRVGDAASGVGDRMELALAGFGVTYLLGLILTRFVLDAVVLFDQRFLAPLQMTSYVLLIAVTHRLLARLLVGRAPVWSTDVVIGIALLALVVPGARRVPDDHRYLVALGGLQAAADVEPPLGGLGASTRVFTNSTAGTWASTGLTTYALPSRVELTTLATVADFDERVDQVVALAQRDDVALYVTTAAEPAADPADYTSRGLVVLAECPDGALVLGRAGSPLTDATRQAPCRAPG